MYVVQSTVDNIEIWCSIAFTFDSFGYFTVTDVDAYGFYLKKDVQKPQ